MDLKFIMLQKISHGWLIASLEGEGEKCVQIQVGNSMIGTVHAIFPKIKSKRKIIINAI